MREVLAGGDDAPQALRKDHHHNPRSKQARNGDANVQGVHGLVEQEPTAAEAATDSGDSSASSGLLKWRGLRRLNQVPFSHLEPISRQLWYKGQG